MLKRKAWRMQAYEICCSEIAVAGRREGYDGWGQEGNVAFCGGALEVRMTKNPSHLFIFCFHPKTAKRVLSNFPISRIPLMH